MAATLPWVAALPSDDEEEDKVQQPQKTFPVAAVAEAEFHVVEDDEVQVLNVVKHEEQRRRTGMQVAGQHVHPWQFSGTDSLAVAPEHSMDIGGEAFCHLAATPMPMCHHQQVEPIPRSRRRKEAQKQKRPATASFDIQSGRSFDGELYYRQGAVGPGPVTHFEERGSLEGGAATLWMEEGLRKGGEPPSELSRQAGFGRGHISAPVNQAQLHGRVQEHYSNVIVGHQPREYGILGGGPASQVRERRTFTEGSVQLSRGEHDFPIPERDPNFAPTGCERLLVAQGYQYGRYVEQERFDTVRAPEQRVLGPPGKGAVVAPCSLQRMVTGNTMEEWWNSLHGRIGTNLSKLHWDIVSFCEAHELTPKQNEIRREAFMYVAKAVHELWPSAEVHLFGSTATGLALPWSDIDVAVILSHQQSGGQKSATISWLSELGGLLKRHGQCRSLKQIPHAKVPLLKVVFKSGLACDISFNAHNGPRGVPVICQFMQQYEALRPLCLVLKFYLGQLNLNELYLGGLGSFCLISMVVSHLQKLGVIGTGHDLGVLLLSFFVRYSTMHNYRTDVVSTRADFFASKQAKGWVNLNNPELLSVEDPLDPTSDIAKGSHRIQDVRTKFSKAKSVLLTHWYNDNVLAKLNDTIGNRNHKPKVQIRKYQAINQRNQKKRKQFDTTGSEMEHGQPVQLKRKQKAHCKLGSGLAGRKTKKQKTKQKEGKNARSKEKILTDFRDSNSTGFNSRLKRARR